MVGWAKENAASSGLSDAPIRWLVDDCVKFVEREIRRGNHYDAIIMDPPSYGRGPKGEIWKIEDAIHPLVKLCAQLLSDDPLFFLINSYTTGLAPAVLTYMMAYRHGDGRVAVSVRDTGPGISPENLSRVFDPYFTTKGQGTGLGLAIVHKIIEAHGGEVGFRSEPGTAPSAPSYCPLSMQGRHRTSGPMRQARVSPVRRHPRAY